MHACNGNISVYNMGSRMLWRRKRLFCFGGHDEIIKNSNVKAVLGACWLVGTKNLVAIITEAQKLFQISGDNYIKDRSFI